MTRPTDELTEFMDRCRWQEEGGQGPDPELNEAERPESGPATPPSLGDLRLAGASSIMNWIPEKGDGELVVDFLLPDGSHSITRLFCGMQTGSPT
jgi:hypothetical protein